MRSLLLLFQVITFIDLAGHERYLKTTIFGMTGHVPDFAMLMVSYHFTQFTYILQFTPIILLVQKLLQVENSVLKETIYYSRKYLYSLRGKSLKLLQGDGVKIKSFKEKYELKVNLFLGGVEVGGGWVQNEMKILPQEE